jgi:hypothetical protein
VVGLNVLGQDRIVLEVEEAAGRTPPSLEAITR